MAFHSPHICFFSNSSYLRKVHIHTPPANSLMLLLLLAKLLLESESWNHVH